jgi:tetratricopeptide (TPR) repeat protein
VVAILAVVLLRAGKDPVLFWAAGFFAIVLLPASNLVVLIGSIMAERFLYLPALGFTIAAAALLFRLRNSRAPIIVLSAAILLFAARASVRNEAWRDDLSLTATDVRVVPDNLHFHTALAGTLYGQDPRGNLDAAIREQEIGVGIMRDLPPERIYVPAVADLGMMYGQKAEAVGGAQTAEGRSWYAKSLETLLRARAASQLGEKAYDALQVAHGKPVGKRSAYGRLYGVLGVTYGKLGRFPESLEAYQYARALDPEAPGPYIDLANGYVNAGDWPSAAVTLLEQGLALGFSPDTVRAIGSAYARVPGGECSLQTGGGVPMVNSGCPKVRADFCPALAGLDKVFTEGREPERARAFRETAARQYGCPVQ